jgi:hypothetical protein
VSIEADIRVLFLNNLGRVVDPIGLASYLDNVRNEGWSIEDVANSLRNSEEYKNRDNVIRKAYRTFLGEEPSASEVAKKSRENVDTHIIVKEIRDLPEAADFRDALTRDYLGAYSDVNKYANQDAFSHNTFKGGAAYLGALDHWNRYGKNENRVIPRTNLLVIDPRTKQLTLADRKYFSNNAWNTYQKVIKRFQQSSGGNYEQLIKDTLKSFNDLGDGVTKNSFINGGGVDAVKGYYTDKKVTAWDAERLGAQPLVGGFDVEYYKTEDPESVKNWDNVKSFSVDGIKFDNPDYTARFDLDTYLQYRYTTTGKEAGLRGNAAVEPEEATQYVEKLTDAELQVYRDSVLGLTKKSPTPSDPDNLTIDWEDEAQSTLEQATLKVLEAREAQEQQVFGALTQDALKQASQKLLEQKRRESNLSLFQGLPGYDEILSVNETLANSLLGDTGVGGILSITQDPEKTQESLEKQISQFTGISSNSTIYNWQNWFDTEFTKRYQEMTEVMSPEDAAQMLQVEQEFAQTFIDQYLKPRFDQSKSMDEFISYMDVKEEEQNIFQTQDAVNALKDVANVRAKLFYDQIKSATGGKFDSNFYFDPTVDQNEAKTDLYQKQKDEVAKDWEDAKNNGDTVKVGQYTWDQWAYYYGLNPNNKDDFARLHYQVKGLGEGFDPAEDVVTIDDARAYINNVVVPAIEQADLEIGDQPFLQFTTPEEFADELLEGISPEENKEEWNRILEMYGLDPLSSSLEEVKDYIIEAVRTNQAKDIRESIKYLNEKKLKPTQERLGVTYIERPEDEKTVDNPEETALYTIFKNSGYAGSEDQFYDEFMSDTSKSEQQLLAKAMSGDLSLTEIGTDPFEALADVSSFFGTEEDIFGSQLDKSKEEEDKATTSSYFRLFEDDEVEPTKSNAAESYISEFTSLFKGFK